MRVTIRLFARLRELAGCAELPGDLPEGATVRDAWNLLARQVPAVAEYEASLSAAVNADYARFTTTLREGDEVSFLPPVSGGDGGARNSAESRLTADCRLATGDLKCLTNLRRKKRATSS